MAKSQIGGQNSFVTKLLTYIGISTIFSWSICTIPSFESRNFGLLLFSAQFAWFGDFHISSHSQRISPCYPFPFRGSISSIDVTLNFQEEYINNIVSPYGEWTLRGHKLFFMVESKDNEAITWYMFSRGAKDLWTPASLFHSLLCRSLYHS